MLKKFWKPGKRRKGSLKSPVTFIQQETSHLIKFTMNNPLPPDRYANIDFANAAAGGPPKTFSSRFLIKYPPEMTRLPGAQLDVSNQDGSMRKPVIELDTTQKGCDVRLCYGIRPGKRVAIPAKGIVVKIFGTINPSAVEYAGDFEVETQQFDHGLAEAGGQQWYGIDSGTFPSNFLT